MIELKKILKPAIAAAFLALAPMTASAATVDICAGGSPTGPNDIGTGDTYSCELTLSGAAATSGSVTLDFFSNIIPLTAATTTANLGGSGSSFTTAMLEWFDMPGGTLLGSVALTDIFGIGFGGALATVFSGPATDYQYTVLSWTGFTSNSGTLNVSVQVSAVPVPAAGFLLLGALGGLGMLRRRRKAA